MICFFIRTRMSSPNLFRVIFVVSWRCVFCHSFCHMWQLTTPNNFKTSAFGSRRFIQGWHFVFPDQCFTLSLLHSHKFSFHPIHLKQFGAFHFTPYVFSQPIISFHFYWYDSIASNTKTVHTILYSIIVSGLLDTNSFSIILIGDFQSSTIIYQFVHLGLYIYILPSQPIRTLEFVYLYPTKSYIPICTRILR